MSLKETLRTFFIGGERFKREIREEIKLLIILSLGFGIAFSWRQTAFDAFESVVKSITNIQNSTLANILTSSVITLVSLIVIFLVSKFMQD